MNTQAFPVKAELKIVMTGDRGQLIHELPFRYTVRGPRHWGLLKRAYRRDGTRRLASPTNKHFKNYAGVLASSVRDYLKNGEQSVTIQIYGPLAALNRNTHIYAAYTVYLYSLIDTNGNYHQRSFHALRSKIAQILRNAVTSYTKVYLSKAGYKPQRRPRKYLHAKRKYWYNYKGVRYGYVNEKAVMVTLDNGYTGSLLDLHAIRDILKHVNKDGVARKASWVVNTEMQAIEAKLLVKDSEVSVRE